MRFFILGVISIAILAFSQSISALPSGDATGTGDSVARRSYRLSKRTNSNVVTSSGDNDNAASNTVVSKDADGGTTTRRKDKNGDTDTTYTNGDTKTRVKTSHFSDNNNNGHGVSIDTESNSGNGGHSSTHSYRYSSNGDHSHSGKESSDDNMKPALNRIPMFNDYGFKGQSFDYGRYGFDRIPVIGDNLGLANKYLPHKKRSL